MIIKRISMLDHQAYAMDIDVDPIVFDNYTSGYDNRLIQEVFPNLTVGEREFIKSGITPGKWKEAFGKHP